MHLYDYLDSGNGYKVRLLLAQLGQKYDWTNVDIDSGQTRTPEFLKRNPNGRIPTLELDDGTNLPESNAILWYLAEGTPFIPSDKLGINGGKTHGARTPEHKEQRCPMPATFCRLRPDYCSLAVLRWPIPPGHRPPAAWPIASTR